MEVPLQEQGRVAEDFLSGLISEFGLTANITVTEREEENLDLALNGHDLGLLIGQKGATLLAVQDLTRTVVQHKTSASNGRIHVDIGGYRQKRAEALAKFANEVAAKVRQTGQRTALEPMSAADRKVVHDTITGLDGVSTISEGEEPRRRVVILPAE
ncbi:MAG TPA: R3H domain-containing nucleic acid-binding protein [Acidimicrobiales bacterium]|nr:R3H domain-containing nucleic acid-binding protein [Acidimicrobiales bacterium]